MKTVYTGYLSTDIWHFVNFHFHCSTAKNKMTNDNENVEMSKRFAVIRNGTNIKMPHRGISALRWARNKQTS